MPEDERTVFDAVLFDMDGVVVDSAAVIEYAWGLLYRRHHGAAPDPALLHGQVHGRTGDQTVAALFPEHSPEQRRAIWAEVDAIEETAPYRLVPGVRDALESLRGNGIPVGLVTSSWPAKIAHVLTVVDLPDPFDVVVSRDDVTRGKPDPEPYRTGCARLGVPPGRTLVFEDSASGVRSAVAAGAACAGVGDERLREHGAGWVVPDFDAVRLVPESGANSGDGGDGGDGDGRAGWTLDLGGEPVRLRRP